MNLIPVLNKDEKSPLHGRLFLYMDKRGELSLWQKLPYLWHRYRKTPRPYAETRARVFGGKPDYGMCFWGTQKEFPEDTGYTYIGEVL